MNIPNISGYISSINKTKRNVEQTFPTDNVPAQNASSVPNISDIVNRIQYAKVTAPKRNLALSAQTTGQSNNSLAMDNIGLGHKITAAPAVSTPVKLPDFLTTARTYLFGTPQQKQQLQALQEEKEKQNYNQQMNNPTAGQAFATNFANSASLGLLQNAPNAKQVLNADVRTHPVASTIGNLAGYAIPGAAADKGVSLVARPFLEKLGTSVAGKIAGNVLTGAASNALVAGASDKFQGASNQQAAKDAAIQGLVGGAIGGIGGAVANRAAISQGIKEAAMTDDEKAAQASENKAVANAEKLLPSKDTGVVNERPALDIQGNTVKVPASDVAEQAATDTAIPASEDIGKVPYGSSDFYGKNTVGSAELEPHKYMNAIVDQAAQDAQEAPPQQLSEKIKDYWASQPKVSQLGFSDEFKKPLPEQFLKTDLEKADKASAKDIRYIYTGKINSQIVAGNQLATAMRRLAPKEQDAIQWYLDYGGNRDALTSLLNDSDKSLDPYRADIEGALNLSPTAQKAADAASEFYKTSGEISKTTGAIDGTLDNYANRIWQKKDTGKASTEVFKSGLSAATSHSKPRVFTNLADGIKAGYKPATTNAADLLSVYNQEMAKSNASLELANAVEKAGFGGYVDKIPTGWSKVDGWSHGGKYYVLPDNIAKGLAAITQPNYIMKINGLRHIQKFQGLVKTVDLSFSLFHDLTLSAQALYNTHGGIDLIKGALNHTIKGLNNPDFLEAERWWASQGLMTSKIQDNYDVIMKLSKETGLLGKLVKLPGLKQLTDVSEAHNNFLFGKLQRWLKVNDAQIKIAQFVAKHPDADTIQINKTARSISEEVNAAYGGLNWEALGATKSMVGVMRLALLAPDWTSSSALMIGKAFQKGAGGAAARSQYLYGIIGGAMLLEELNKLFTGHYTDKNASGHELQIEVQPGVYVSPFRSGIGDVTKWIGNMVQNGIGAGTVQLLQSKLSPLARASVGVLSNRNYQGQQIINSKNSNIQNELALGKYLASEAGPIPFGVPNVVRYNQKSPANGTQKVIGNALVGTGAANYSAGSNSANKAEPYANNWIYGLEPAGQQEQAAESAAKAYKKQQSDNTSALKSEIAKGNTDTWELANKYSKTEKQVESYVSSSKKKNAVYYAGSQVNISNDTSSYPALLKSYASMSADGQKAFYNKLSIPQRQALNRQIESLIGK